MRLNSERSVGRPHATARPRPALLALLALSAAVAGCSQSADTLRLVGSPPPGNQEVAALLARASNEVEVPVRLDLVGSVESADAALAALESGTADLAIVENRSSYRHSTVRTVVPLYLSVLHIGIRPEQQGRKLREILDEATVFAGAEDAPARQLLDLLRLMYASSGVEFSYADSLESGPDVVIAFSPISPRLAPLLEGYELFSLGRPEDVGIGSGADGLSLVAPLLRPFVIPEGTYGDLTPTAIATVAIDTLLVARAELPRVVVYDLMQAMQTMGPRLVAERPDLKVDEFDQFGFSHLTFPVHAGSLAFRARSEPGFFERAAGLFEAAVTAVAAFGTVLLAFFRYWRGLRKSRIDDLYAQALAIREKLSAGLSTEQRRACVAELRALRDHAFTLLMNEKLLADESFRILQALIGDVMQELEKGGSAGDPLTAG
jgi:NMT1-like family